jgi:hypothetical protein
VWGRLAPPHSVWVLICSDTVTYKKSGQSNVRFFYESM